MKKIATFILLALLPTVVMAQAVGGQVTRPVKKQQNTQQTRNKPTNSSPKKKIFREVSYESTLSAEERKVWNEERAKAKEEMKQLAYILKSQNIEPKGNFFNGLARCNLGYIDKRGNLVIKSGNYRHYDFHNGYAIIEKDNKYGVIDKKGSVLIPANYDEIHRFSEGYFCVIKDKKVAYFDEKGSMVIPFIWNRYYLAIDPCFKEDFACVCNEKKRYGYIDRNGKVAIPFEYDFAYHFKEGLAPVKKNGKWGYIDKQGKTIIPFIYDNAYTFSEGFGRVEKNGKVGFVNSLGAVVIPIKYGRYPPIGDIVEGYAYVNNNSQAGYGYIDTNGKIVIPYKYREVSDFSEGLACVAITNKLNGCNYGFINKKGQVVIPLKFEKEHIENYQFSEGLAYIEQETKGDHYNKVGGFVDKYGNSTFDF